VSYLWLQGQRRSHSNDAILAANTHYKLEVQITTTLCAVMAIRNHRWDENGCLDKAEIRRALIKTFNLENLKPSCLLRRGFLRMGMPWRRSVRSRTLWKTYRSAWFTVFVLQGLPSISEELATSAAASLSLPPRLKAAPFIRSICFLTNLTYHYALTRALRGLFQPI
jgi:hypothetical protein